MKISNKQYILAYFDLAKEKNDLEKNINELEKINQHFGLIKPLVDDPNLSDKEKMDNLAKLNLGQENINLLLLLKKNNNLSKFNLIINGLRKKINYENGILESNLTTANPLNDQERIEIKKKIEDIFKSKINMSEKVDKNILGGFIISIEDKLIDASLKNQLNLLRQELIK